MSLFSTVEDSRNNNFSKTETSALGPQPSQLDPAIKYNTPPEKVTRVKQQDSIELENLPFSSEEDKPSVESCAPIRSTTPRSSASPVRRILRMGVQDKISLFEAIRETNEWTFPG
ncbi:hypothetical protein Tco_1179814 [Tanacetum coccineum]